MLRVDKLPLLAKLYDRAHNLPPDPKRFVKFLFVGGFGFIVDFVTFNLVHGLLDNPATTLDENISQAVSFSVAVASNFLWNIYWIYPAARAKALGPKTAQFVIVSVLSLIIRTPIFNLALPVTNRVAALPIFASLARFNPGNNLALATAVLVVMLWNFFVNRYWTYRDAV